MNLLSVLDLTPGNLLAISSGRLKSMWHAFRSKKCAFYISKHLEMNKELST